jgi:hypothetical protein
MTIDDNERQALVNQLIRDLATNTAATRNRATDAATRRGATEGAQGALESGLEYSAGMAGEKGLNSLNTSIDEQNRQAERYLQSLIDADKARKAQMWSGIGQGAGTLAGFALGGPLGAWAAKSLGGLAGGNDTPTQMPVMPNFQMPKTKPNSQSFGLDAFGYGTSNNPTSRAGIKANSFAKGQQNWKNDWNEVSNYTNNLFKDYPY